MKKFSLIIFLLLGVVLLSSCYEELTNNPQENQEPDTGLFLYPDTDTSISSQPSKLNVHWWGDDKDGLIVGFYFTWDGTNWTFTPSNDSLFALQIGAKDTSYTFMVSAVDDGGNGIYDSNINQNGINYGAEPFTDENENGTYDEGEPYYDIGLIDSSPAELTFPIRNSAPTVEWNELSILPDTSFPAMSFGWEATDLDGDETIQSIQIALNDTSANNIVSLSGNIRRITIRTDEFDSDNPLMEILIDGDEKNINTEELPGLKFNADNKFYVQAIDISGAASGFISLPDSGSTWYVKKPAGKLIVIDDYKTSDNAAEFYSQMFDSLSLTGHYDVYDIHNQTPPYLNVTFLETIKLYDYIFWYSDNSPSLDLAAVSVQDYISQGGKVAFSIQFPQNVDLDVLQGIVPPVIADSSDFKTSLIGGSVISADTTNPAYPELETTISLFRVRSFYLNPVNSIPIYYFKNNELNGFIGFMDSQKNLFMYGLPMHRSNGGAANVKQLLQKVLFDDFGLTI